MKNKKAVKWSILLVSSLTVMSAAVIAPSLPQIKEHFKDTANIDFLSRLLLTMPALFIALFSPVIGYLIDRFGRLNILFASLVLYGFAGSSGLFLDSLFSILIGRVFLGLAIAGTMTIATTLIADYFEGSERYEFMGKQGAFMALGGMVFISLSGVLADIHWRGPFAVYLFSFFILPFVMVHLFEPAREKREPQPRRNNTHKGTSRLIISIIYMISFFYMIIFYMIPVQIPFFIKSIADVNNLQVALGIAAATLASTVTSVNYRRMRTRLSFKGVYSISFLLMSIGYGVISYSQNYASVIAGLLISGLGLGFTMPNTSLWLVSLAPEHIRGRLVGGLTFSIFLGQFLSPIVLQPLVSRVGMSLSFRYAAVMIMLWALLFFISTMFKGNRKTPASS